MADDTEDGAPVPVGRDMAPTRKTAARGMVVAGGLLLGIIGYPSLVLGLNLLGFLLFRNADAHAFYGTLITLALAAIAIVCLRVRRHSLDLALGILLPSVLWFGALLFLVLKIR